MTTKQFQTSFYFLIGFCILIVVYSFTSFDFIEVGTATEWTMRYFSLPILISMIPFCSYLYLRFIRQHETKEYKSKIRTNVRIGFRISILTFAMTVISTITTLSLIILTNYFLGESKTISINAEIVDYYTLRSKGNIRHYIKIKDQQLDRIIDLKVNKPYEVGQSFNKEMKIGKWGLIYSRK